MAYGSHELDNVALELLDVLNIRLPNQKVLTQKKDVLPVAGIAFQRQAAVLCCAGMELGPVSLIKTHNITGNLSNGHLQQFGQMTQFCFSCDIFHIAMFVETTESFPSCKTLCKSFAYHGQILSVVFSLEAKLCFFSKQNPTEIPFD